MEDFICAMEIINEHNFGVNINLFVYIKYILVLEEKQSWWYDRLKPREDV